MNAPTYIARPAYAVSTARSLLGLAEIATQIINTFYSIGSIKTATEYLLRTKVEIGANLDHWIEDLPDNLRFDSDTDPTPPPHQITPQ